MKIYSRTIEIFIECAKTKSFQEAAKLLGQTPSNLSMAIKVLERELGTKVFDRSRNGIVLTPQGQALHKNLSKNSQKIKTSIADSVLQAKDRPLKIGCVSHFGNRYLLSQYKSLSKNLPPLQIFFGYSRLILNWVLDESLDIGIITWSHLPKEVESYDLGIDPQSIVGLKKKFPEISKLTSRASLKDYPWVFHNKPQYHWTYYVGNRTGQVFVVDNYSNYKSILLNGLAIGEVQLDSFENHELKKLAFSKVSISRTIKRYLIHRQDVGTNIREIASRLESIFQK